MTTQEQYIERLKELVVAEFGRNITATEDCIALSNAVNENVGIVIDVESLEQLFTVENSHTAPRPVMLSSLARYVGFTGWSDFCTARDITPADDVDRLPIVRRWGVIILTAVAVITVIISAIVLISRGASDDDEGLNVDSRVRSVESAWVSRTSERCNSLRAYYNENDAERYNQRVDKYISKYRTMLERNVKNEVENYALQNKITVDNATIEQTADIIIQKCISMCESVKIE
jgi:hypothetical protein